MIDTNNEIAIIADIENTVLKWKAQMRAVADAQYIESLIYADYIRKCKKYKTRYDYIQPTMEKAWHEWNNKKDAIKGEKVDRTHCKVMQDLIREDFFNNDKKAKIVDVIAGGFENYYIRFEVIYNGYIFYIEIPMIDAINDKNIEYAHYGKISVAYAESKYIPRNLIQSYSIEEIRNVINKFLEENEETT